MGVFTPTGALRARWAVLMVLVAAVLVGAANVVYTGHVQQQSERRQEQARQEAERRWCPLLATLDQPGVPATTERGRVVQEQIHQLRIETGCEER
ncbi:hypothetical protein [Streptomyces sp.]|uniref:hypothetical protein n=1 Tax=Streptomyces sp. TaxID=1931 RepID=UPI002F957A2E